MTPELGRCVKDLELHFNMFVNNLPFQDKTVIVSTTEYHMVGHASAFYIL